MAKKPQYSSTTGKWSTKKINELLKFMDDEGIIPMDNPFYKRQTEWRKAGIEFELTKEEFEEFTRINDDILYYAEKYSYAMTDQGNKLVKLRKYQVKTLLQLHHYQKNVLMQSRQSGKCVTYDTIIELKDPRSNFVMRIPIFELYYRNKIQQDKSILLKLEYFLYKVLFKLKN